MTKQGRVSAVPEIVAASKLSKARQRARLRMADKGTEYAALAFNRADRLADVAIRANREKIHAV